VIAEPVDPIAVRRQNELFDLHRSWVEQHENDVPFHPEEWPAAKSEYNIHTLDIEASGAAFDDFHDRALQLFENREV
jgi:hypothetical protein